jgi:hypothetical protein
MSKRSIIVLFGILEVSAISIRITSDIRKVINGLLHILHKPFIRLPLEFNMRDFHKKTVRQFNSAIDKFVPVLN